MTSEGAPKKASALSPDAFGRFLDWLSPDRERAARQYLEIRRKMAQLFIRRGCDRSDELADTTLDRAVLIFCREPDKYSEPLALCFGVARNVWLEYLREPKPDPLDTREITVIDSNHSQIREHEASCLSTCVERLSNRERDLIVQYHQFRGREKIELRKRLAEQYGGFNKLRITAHRIRARLNDCISGCLEHATSGFVHI
jgi:DNA-directed RNA polymerase specialized sigma24 family protein